MLSEPHRKCRRGKLMLFVGRCAITVLIALLPAATAFSQSDSVDRGTSANDLARAVVANELKSQDANHSRWMYHVDRDEQGKKKAKEVTRSRKCGLPLPQLWVQCIPRRALPSSERRPMTKTLRWL